MKTSGKKRRKHARRRWLGLLPVIVAVMALAGLLVWMERPSSGVQEPRGDYRLRYQYDTIVEFDGVKYRRRKNVTTILMMGVDRESDRTVSRGIFDGGQADFQRLVVIDSERKRVAQIQIDRDTMTPVTVIGPLGDRIGRTTAAICLAHSYGDGREQSCENAVEALSGFLLDTPIDFYIAMNMDGINVLNDFVGGVTVTLEEDFSHLDPEMTRGKTVKLVGDQAELFVRRRMDIGDGSNEARLKRQQQYVSRFTAMLNERINADKNYVGRLFDVLGDYLVTDISRGRLINEAWNARQYARVPLYAFPGTHTVNENNHMEFYADQAAVRQVVLELFYEPLK